MNTPTNASGADRASGLYRWGGVAAVVIGAIYLVIIALYASAGVPPPGGQAKLDYLAGQTTLWWAIVDLSVLTNFLYVPLSLALYVALRRVNRDAMLIGVACVGLFVVLENAVNWTSYGALLRLSAEYSAATSESQRAIIVAAATYASAVLDSPLAGVWAIGTLSVGFLVIGLVMLESAFTRLTAGVGIVTGILGIAAAAGVGIAVIPNAVSALVWLLLVGVRLYRLDGSDGGNPIVDR